jgi:hypothetical protein
MVDGCVLIDGHGWPEALPKVISPSFHVLASAIAVIGLYGNDDNRFQARVNHKYYCIIHCYAD